jgi:ketosteroid isomerase-like protein
MEIVERDREFERNVEAKDAAKLCRDLYAPSAKLLPPGGAAIYGRAAIEPFWAGLLDAGLTDVHLDTTEIVPFGDMAYAVGTYRLAVRPEGAEGMVDKGKYVYIYKRQPDGSWKAIIDIFNSDGTSS